jgi:16S rRNA (guanine(1405)-N(7))-methyltransferase
MPALPSAVEDVVAAVAASTKYGDLCADTIRRVAARELAHHGSAKAAVKATKRRLHQVYAAFEEEIDYDAAYRMLKTAYSAGAGQGIRAACGEIMARHASTRERLPILDRFYEGILAVTGVPASILDLGCGLNPLSLPWMGPHLESYVALDIDARRIAFLNRYLQLAGLQPLARCQDVLVRPPEDQADLALLLKTSPSLERQEPGATLRLLDGLRVRFVAVSFSVKSLGGREKGMQDHYHEQFMAMSRERRWPVERLVLDTELVFLIDKAPAAFGQPRGAGVGQPRRAGVGQPRGAGVGQPRGAAPT